MASTTSGHQPPELADLPVREAARRIGAPGGHDAVHLADHAVGSEPMDHRQIVGMPEIAQVLDHREVGRIATGEVAPQLAVAAFQQMVEWALMPCIHPPLVRAGPFEFDQRRCVGRVAVPAEQPALIDRVQRVDDRDAPRHRDPGGAGPFAEAAQQLGLGRAVEAAVGDPRGDVGGRLIHAAGSSPSCRSRIWQRRDRQAAIRPKRDRQPNPCSRCGRPSATS